MRRSVGYVLRSTVLATMAWITVGCASSWPRDVNVALDPSLNNGGAWKQVKVHLIGTSDAAKIKDLKKISVSDYWQPDGRSQRPDPDRIEMDLGPASQSQTLSRKDPIWNRWLTGKYPALFILADLRDPDREGEGTDDSRRVILPLDKSRWPGSVDVIRIAIERGRVNVLTPPSPP